MNPIFEYKSLSDFLSDFRRSKMGKRKLGFSELSKRLKYSSDRTLGMVYKGQRLPSGEMQKRISNYLNLTPKEGLYLSTLVLKEKLSKRGSDLSDVEAKLVQLRPVKSDYITLSEDQLVHMTQWYYFPVKNLIYSAEHGISLDEIFQGLEEKVEKADIARALEVLGLAKIINFKNKFYYPELEKGKYLRSKIDVPSKSLREAHVNMLKRSMEALEQQSLLDRLFLSKTLVIPENKIEKAKQRIRDLCEELSDELMVSDQKEPKVIYQLSLQFFRQGKIIKK